MSSSPLTKNTLYGMRKAHWLLAWIHLVRIYHKVQRHESAFLAQYGLTLAQFDVLRQLVNHEGLTQQELADRLLVTKGNVCGLIDRLSYQGLLERQADLKDKRTNHLLLTDRGREVAQTVIPLHEAMMEQLLTVLDPQASALLMRLLSRLDHELDHAP